MPAPRILAALLVAALASSCGVREEPGPTAPAPQEVASPDAPPAIDDALAAQLEAIGYVDGTTPAEERQGVVVHDRERAQPGLNFYVSGHGPEALLMDMEGRVLHRWHHDFDGIWPRFPAAWRGSRDRFWRRAHLFENGDVLAIFEGLGLIKLDRDSLLLWARPNGAHHDLEVLPNGDIYLLTRRGELVPKVDPDQPIFVDCVTLLDAEGNEKHSFSLIESFARSEFDPLWDPGEVRLREVFHTNSLSLLNGSAASRVPGLQPGRLLISLLIPHLIGVVDPEQERVVWARKGIYRSQHDPKLLANGNLLLFDNLGRGKASRVLEIDPATGEVVWSYPGTGDEPLFSRCCGTAERLANGNTLIVVSEQGRALEVTPRGEIVWEFVSPHRAGSSRELVATLFDLVRLPSGFPSGWVRGPEASED